MSTPIITVIVPIFNESDYIDRCMNSLQAQTHRRLQIILVDGGSTDGSGQLCDKWATRWNMGPGSNMGIVEVIHTANKGVSESRNKGLSHAAGEYVTFLDGDDWLEPDAISKMCALLESEQVDMAGLSFISRYPGEENSEKVSDDPAFETMTAREFLAGHILKGDVHVWGRLYKRDLIGDLRFRKDLTIGEDMLFVIEYVKKCDRVAHMSYRGYDYFRNPGGTMARPFSASSMDQVKCWDEARLLLAHEDERLADGPALRSNMLIAVMLTASRMALLDRDTVRDEEHREYIRVLRARIKEYRNRAAMKALDHGYRLKVRLFRTAPGLYMSLYHKHKNKK